MPNDGRMLPSDKKNNIVTLNLPPEKYLELADDKAARGEYIDALTLLDRALRFEPDNEELIIRRIEILTEIGDFEDAMWLIAKYIAKFGEDNERALILLGNLYFEMQEFGAALDAYTLVENRLDDSDLYDDEVDKMIEAMDYCEYMLGCDIDDIDDTDDIDDVDGADEDEKTGDRNCSDRRRNNLNVIRDVSEMEHERLIVEAQTLFEKEDYDAIIELLEPAMLKDRSDQQLMYLLVLSYYLKRDFVRGAQFLKRAKPETGCPIQLHCLAALVFLAADMRDDAEEECAKAIGMPCSDSASAAKIYITLCELGNRLDDEMKYAKLCYTLSPYNKEQIHIYARCLALHGKRIAAISLYQRILRLSPEDAEARYFIKLIRENKRLTDDDLQVSYMLPIGMFMEKMIPLLEKMSEDTPLTDRDCVYIRQMLKLIIRTNNRSWMQRLLPSFIRNSSDDISDVFQYIIKSPFTSDELKDTAMNCFLPESENSSTLIYREGRLMMATLNPLDENAKNAVEMKLKLANLIKEYLDDSEHAPWCEEAYDILFNFMAVNPDITDESVMPLAAAIVYCAKLITNEQQELSTDDVEKILNDFEIDATELSNAVDLLEGRCGYIKELLEEHENGEIE